VVAPSLDEQGAPASSSVPPGGQLADGLTSLPRLAHDHYLRALQAQRDGDWARYGEEIERLGEVLERMQEGQ